MTVGQTGKRQFILIGRTPAILLLAVVHQLAISHSHGDFRRHDRQRAELFPYYIVRLLGGVIIALGSPRDCVRVVRFANFGLRASDFKTSSFAVNQTLERITISLLKRRAVIRLLGRAGSHMHRFGCNLQSALADKQAHAVIVVFRQHILGQAHIVRVVARILLGLYVVMKTRGARIVCCKIGNLLPNRIQVLTLIPCMTNEDVILNTLGPVRETGLLLGAVVNVTRPAVRLDTNGHVDLRHFQRAADVAHFVVLRMPMSGNDGVFRGDRCHACIDAARSGARLCVRVRVAEINALQRIAILQALDDYLVRQSARHGQRRTVVLLARTYSGNGGFLLVVQRKLEAVGSNRIGNPV